MYMHHKDEGYSCPFSPWDFMFATLIGSRFFHTQSMILRPLIKGIVTSTSPHPLMVIWDLSDKGLLIGVIGLKWDFWVIIQNKRLVICRIGCFIE